MLTQEDSTPLFASDATLDESNLNSFSIGYEDIVFTLAALMNEDRTLHENATFATTFAIFATAIFVILT